MSPIQFLLDQNADRLSRGSCTCCGTYFVEDVQGDGMLVYCPTCTHLMIYSGGRVGDLDLTTVTHLRAQGLWNLIQREQDGLAHHLGLFG